MNRFISFFRNRHNTFYRLFLFGMAAVVIVYLLPKAPHFPYDLSELKGKVWQHENFVAPFDFAVEKSKEELEAEKALTIQNLEPCYLLNEQTAEQTKKEFARVWADAVAAPDPRAQNIPVFYDWIDSLYSRGIIKRHAGHQQILYIKGSYGQDMHVRDFPDAQQADTMLQQKMDELRFAPSLREAAANIVIQPNLVFDSAYTYRMRMQELEGLALTRGGKSKGQTIIREGDVVTEERYEELLSLQAAYTVQGGGSKSWVITLGQGLLVISCLVILFIFLRLFRRETLGSDTKVMSILIMMVLMVMLSRIPAVFITVPLLALPFCILPVVMRAFFDTRTALFTHLLTMFMITMSVPDKQYDFVFIQVIAGIASIFSIVNMRNRSQIFFSVVIIFSAYAAIWTGLQTVEEGTLVVPDYKPLLYFAFSAFLVLLAYPLIFIFEKLFGFVSDVTLLELSDTNHPLLRELASKAPGTFQHSLQISNLAEEAIHRIGGNALLVRTGALFHDIGKADMPMYFIENKVGDVNPHDELSFEESARIIISHVEIGIEKAKAARLPDAVIDFIRTHHGTTNTAYFLTMYKKNNPEQEINEELFRYPGPIPFSKETAVVMMADAVEAASRSLARYDLAAIDDLVDRIIGHQVEQEQFNNADITLRDIAQIKIIFKKKLRSIYHVRLAYPG
jgi:putative nucleotidyltransferase with HDIG domain